jgi:site-specific DNA-methyltransferase (adenine-specific)
MNTNQIIEGDCRDVLADLPAESAHAVVTDPPYGLAFMGRDWDDFEPKEYQQWCEEWARECLRVLKPGGHMLAFSGNRTHHRLFSGVEDAGFEIRDTVTWHYGSGFPKALDVSKAIVKAAGAEREVVGSYQWPDGKKRNWREHDLSHENTYGEADGPESRRAIEEPATDAAREWDGWKTALKPATEFVVLARKPLPGTVAECIQAHGTGALHIGETRIGDEPHEVSDTSYRTASTGEFSNQGISPDERGTRVDHGRYPANVVFDERAAEQLDRKVGECITGDDPGTRGNASHNIYGDYSDGQQTPGYQDKKTGPSRYFYTSKATRAERTLDGRIDNAHPTVKPTDLMEWLVRLVTAKGQLVVDPFAGSGTTCRAAKNLGREFIGIEQQAKWADVSRVRCGLTPENPSIVRGDDGQQGLETYTDGGKETG